MGTAALLHFYALCVDGEEESWETEETQTAKYINDKIDRLTDTQTEAHKETHRHTHRYRQTDSHGHSEAQSNSQLQTKIFICNVYC